MEGWLGVHRELSGAGDVKLEGDQRVMEMGVLDGSGAPRAPLKPSESFRQGNVVRKNVPKRRPRPLCERDSEARLGSVKGSRLCLVHASNGSKLC